jgi:8-oxo-dGTP pyrophosphatase MutT (NUDIX family)
MRREVFEETGLTITETISALPPLSYTDSSNKKTATHY